MLWNLLIEGLIAVFYVIFYFLPVVTIAGIPVIGSTVDTYLTTAVTYWNSFTVIFPYAGDTMNVLLLVILPFELLLIVAKFFLGSHVPKHE